MMLVREIRDNSYLDLLFNPAAETGLQWTVISQYEPFKQQKKEARLKYPKSPLRYPGGKARAVQIVLSLIPNGTRKLISPFLGGGSIEIAAASQGIPVFGFDVFKPLVNFWKHLLFDSELLANTVERLYPLPKDSFYQLQKTTLHDDIESAAIYYVLNRASYSGATLSGGMSPGHPRFTKSSIAYLRQFKSPILTVEYSDFKSSIKNDNDDFMYLDPPYMIASALYGKNGDAHKEFDHLGLAKILHHKSNWILSYNNSPEIRELYSGYRMLIPNWKYGMSNDKDSRELLILSHDIAKNIG